MKLRKKYLFVTNQFQTGGVETVFHNLTKNVDIEALLFPVHLNVDAKLIDELPDNVTLVKNRYKIQRSIFGLIKVIYAGIKYRKTYQKKDLQVINFSDTLTTLLFSYILNPKAAISWIHCNPEALLNVRTHCLYWWLLKRCQRIVFISQSQRKLFFSMDESRGIDTKKAVVCTDFIDSDVTKKIAQEISIKGSYFFTAARLDLRSKDYITLIKAYSSLPSNIRNKYQLLIAGDGPDRNVIERKIRELRLQDRILLLGNVSNPFTYMAKASVFIHASISEGFAMSILEALACGATVVASDCHVGPSEILGNGKYGYLYMPGNCEALTKKISEALETPISSDLAKKRAKEITKLGIEQAKELLENAE